MWYLFGMLASAQAGIGPVACDTLSRLETAPAYQAVDEPGLRINGKDKRDAFNLAFSNEMVTPNFVLKWGAEESFTPEEVDSLLRAFERSWEIENDAMGHVPPDGTSQYLFNIYIGNSGENTPDIQGASGYYTLDPDGWPMVVMNPEIVRYPEYAAKVAAHEWYHALQFQAQQFEYYGIDAWFWEASANWAAAEVYPEHTAFIGQAIAVHLLYPHYAADFFDYPDTGALQEYYQYGAALLPIYLSDALDDWTVVADVWKQPSGGAPPLSRLKDEVSLRGESFDALWLELVTKSAVLDLDPTWQIREELSRFVDYPEYDQLVDRIVPMEGDEDWVKPNTSRLPNRYGYNVVRLQSVGKGTLQIDVQGDDRGGYDTEVKWGAQVVIQRQGNTYVEVPFEGDSGTVELELSGDETSVWLVIGAMSDRMDHSGWNVESFGYQTRFQWLTPPEAPPPVKADPMVDEQGGASTCSSAPLSLGLFWVFIPLLWRVRESA